MANELLTREDIVRGKKNFDAQNKYMTGTAEEQVTLPDGQIIKTRAGNETELINKFSGGRVGLRFEGVAPDQVPLSQDTYRAANSGIDQRIEHVEADSFDCNNFAVGTRNFVSESVLNAPDSVSEDSYFFIETRAVNTSERILQLAWGYVTGALFIRTKISSWSPWRHSSASATIYKTTTATSANVVISGTGELQRSTSSAIFKKDIADITIPDYRAALKAVRPVSYRSTDATSDRTDWSWYSFIAEELAAIDPRLAQMDSTEFFEDTNEDGTTFINSRELPEGEYAANGINTNGIVALMVHISQQMLGDIEKLEDEKTQLKRRMTNLEKRFDTLEGPAA